MAMGEAAGIAAAQVVRGGLAFPQVSVPELQAALRQSGAVLAWPPEENSRHA